MMEPRGTGISDEELMALAQKGDTMAFHQLVQRFKNPLTSFAFRFLGDADEADDVVQETLVRTYRNASSFDLSMKFSTWVYTIATNIARTRARRRSLGRIVRLGFTQDGPARDIASSAPAPDEAADAAIREEQVHAAIQKLPVEFREAIILRDIQELSYEEIAEITGRSVGTVKSRINRGRERLRILLRHILGESS
jgi:RNA polymerase sigma-70 factor (ECF subfamily)